MDIVSAEDVNRTQGLILTEKCGHLKTVQIPSETLDKLHELFRKSVKNLKQESRDNLSPQALKRSKDVDSQVLLWKLSSQVVELGLLSQQTTIAKDNKDWEPTFEAVQAYLLTEVDSHQALLFAKKQRLALLQEQIEDLKRHISQEETIINNSRGKKDGEIEKRRLRVKIEKLEQVLNARSESLVSLINKFFPPLTEEEIIKETGQRNKPKSMRYLFNLLNKRVTDSRHNPGCQWMTLDDSIWKPYVNTLIMAGIAMYNPDGSGRIGMIDFGDD